jgi:hypothetical protein
LQDYRFRFRTGEVIIDYEKCRKCDTYACIKADSLFGRNVLRIHDGKPQLATSFEDAERICNECLACELYCQAYGNKGLIIKLDMFSLDEYKKKRSEKEV